jgi:SAM-dependent methyltransferase
LAVPRIEYYADDLAYVHDVGFGQFARGAAPGVLEILRKSGVNGGAVVDLGCGSGIWARQLTDAGYSVVGVDVSPAMIDIARTRTPEAKFHVTSAWELQFPMCDAVTALGEVLAYEVLPRARPMSLGILLRRIHKALRPGGMLIFDLPNVGLDRSRPPAWFEGEDWACGVRFTYDGGRDRLERKIVTFRRIGKSYRRSEETHVLRLFRGAEVARLLRSVGFAVRIVRSYGEYPLLTGRTGFIARRKVST